MKYCQFMPCHFIQKGSLIVSALAVNTTMKNELLKYIILLGVCDTIPKILCYPRCITRYSGIFIVKKEISTW